MKLPRNVKIFRGQLDAAPFASVAFLLLIFLVLQSKLVFTPGLLLRIDAPEVPLDLPGTANPTVVVAVRVKVSLASARVSLTMGVRTRTLVAPGAKVALVAGVQVVPPSVETCRAVV